MKTLLQTSLNASRRSSRRAGFTLIEIIVALSIFLIILAGVFAIAQGSMELSSDLTRTQEQAMIRQNFIEFLRSSFRRLPGDAEVTMLNDNQRGMLPALTIYNGGEAFSPGEALPPETSVELYASEMPGGALRIGLRLFDSQQTGSMRTGSQRRPAPSKNDVILPLLENVRRFEWKFLNLQTNRWENQWKGPQRPVFAELSMVLEDGVPTRNVFWIPPIMKQAPGGMPGGAPQLGPDGKPLPPGTAPLGPDGKPLPIGPGSPQLSPNANPSLPPR